MVASIRVPGRVSWAALAGDEPSKEGHLLAGRGVESNLPTGQGQGKRDGGQGGRQGPEEVKDQPEEHRRRIQNEGHWNSQRVAAGGPLGPGGPLLWPNPRPPGGPPRGSAVSC